MMSMQGLRLKGRFCRPQHERMEREIKYYVTIGKLDAKQGNAGDAGTL